MKNNAILLTFCTMLLLGFVGAARGHVILQSPDGGESLESGQLYEIVWEQAVYHTASGYNIWYSESGPDGPWQLIIQDLPITDSANYAIYGYSWVVPDISSQTVRIRVRQNTAVGTQWADTSAADATIAGSCCSGTAGNVDGDPVDVIDISDLVFMVTWMFQGGPAPGCATEADIDGSGGFPADISDLVAMVDYMFRSGPLPAGCP